MSICEMPDTVSETHNTLRLPPAGVGSRWLDARARLLELRPDQQEMFARLLTHIESGWSRVRELQGIYDRNAALEAQGGPVSDLLGFIDGDVVDLFRAIVLDAADLVPGWAGWEHAADPGDMDGDAVLFARYVGVLRLAAQSAALDPTLFADVESACAALEGWYARLADVLRSIDEEVIRPSLPPDEW
ncbi:MAG TPA: hypothetical protein VHG08_10345 [Longimicrobium sp.]|nr:hypothetical protein [Longimicrobium sp.]